MTPTSKEDDFEKFVEKYVEVVRLGNGSFLVGFFGNIYQVKASELKNFMGKAVAKVASVFFAESQPRNAVLYHNADETSVTWPARRKRIERNEG